MVGSFAAPIDIQSILNGAAKFCRHCDVVILSNLIRKKVSELPFLAKDDLVENGDDLYFCSSSCYMQFALMHRCPSISEDKVSTTLEAASCKLLSYARD
jgi:histone-lysine N-methyltransferase MLL3